MLVGSGGEAEVFAFGDAQVLRLYRSASGAAKELAAARFELSREIEQASADLPFATPAVVDRGVLDSYPFHIEQRLDGESLATALETIEGDARRRLIVDYLDTALLIGDVAIERAFVGEIGRADAIQCTSWHDYLVERATRSLSSSPLAGVAASEVTHPVGELSGTPALVHLDYCPANVMSSGERVTAVIDFGYAAVMGDRRMNVAAAVAHLLASEITPTAHPDDHHVVHEWLERHGLADYVAAATPWLAAYWTFAHDDHPLFAWCCSVLNVEAPSNEGATSG